MLVSKLQREIEKRTAAYGSVAVLSALLLTILCYNVGFQVGTQPIPSEPVLIPETSEFKTFSSYEELENFLLTRIEKASFLKEQYLPPPRIGEFEILTPSLNAPSEYSTTSIQVAGVDEADVVKTDGEYLYVVSNGKIYILRAYPPEQAQVLSKIPLEETCRVQIYVNGDKLAVLENRFLPILRTPEPVEAPRIFIPYAYEGAFIKIYNVSDRAKPVLTRTVSLNGTLSSSRMIGDYVYAVVDQPAVKRNGDEVDFEVSLPRISSNGAVREVQPTEIRYVDTLDFLYCFTTVVAINLTDDAQEPTYETFLTGAATCIYVSQSNMYLVVPKRNVYIMHIGTSVDTDEPKDETLIYRVKLEGENVTCEAEGTVSGHVLNQFSMDEYQGFFRIATTEWTDGKSKNNLFVLNMSLDVVGKLEDLAPNERIYSARFMNDKRYLVTFRNVDPFFVIDLSDPEEPKVLGKLKIPGFSSYLHPYDENHIIGVGKQDGNIKLSLFDVTNATNPVEIDKFIVQAEWSDSTVLADHKAFLFDKSKQLLAFPVSISSVELKENGYYVKRFWQGVYVFNVSREQGFTLKGKITHQNSDLNSFEGNLEVKRVLYIETVLYTISNAKVKMSDIETLQPLNEVELA